MLQEFGSEDVVSLAVSLSLLGSFVKETVSIVHCGRALTVFSLFEANISVDVCLKIHTRDLRSLEVCIVAER